MNYLIQLTATGIAIGAIYGLIAMAFALVYKSTGLINFAQGEVAMMVAYLTWAFAGQFGSGLIGVAVFTIVAGMVLGLVIERLLIRPMMGEPIFSIVLVTIGLAVILRSLVLLIWDASPHPMGIEAASELIRIGNLNMRAGQVFVIGLMGALLVASWAFFRYSRYGIAMRAVADDDRTALLMGVNTARVQAVAWAASSTIAGMAGVCFAALYDISPDIYSIGLKAFPAAILGGLDAVLGSAFGGIIVGLIENMTGGYMSSTIKEISGFVLIVGVLMIRPSGLFGQREIERV
ncbi:branched-chain amino acid ABC transporter permease [Thalassovita taeanensis]|uniref:Branched-chain amino acid transport system permease protein n=1 Tax=Thalassovita taeanensis TaxID=657014 RepID=A0A1H9HB97_9RHOB|nr:branched-chain amino acid ABC transporter permease [Thalassovita taeanensis]SEQ59518.1 branched-chain amino acid transport system permease protein [Thalassovita taeanensis]